MRMRRWTSAAAIICAVVLAQIVTSRAASAAAGCRTGGKAGNAQIDLYGHCVGAYSPPGTAKVTGPPTRAVALCGGAGDPCTGQVRECFYTAADGTLHASTPFVTQTLVNGTWVNGATWCPGDAVPALVTAAIRDQAIRLLPSITIGHAFADAALVNAEEIFWADTPQVRALPDVTIVGQHIHLQITLHQVHWNFGDTTTDTTNNPGRPYQHDDPCTTPQCPQYYGHTYRTAGTMTVTSTITWTARYRIGGGTWTDITDPITGPATTQQLHVVEGRAVLVPNSR